MNVNPKFYGSHLVGESTSSFFVSNAYHAQGTSSPSHSHDYGCLHFVLDGVYVEKIEDETFVVEPGAILYKPDGIAHSNDFRESDAKTCRIQIEEASDLEINLPNRPLHLTAPIFCSLFGQMQSELREIDDLTCRSIESLSWHIVCQLIRTSVSTNPQVEHVRVRRVIERLKAEFRSPPSAHEIAKEFGIHRGHLSRIFKSHTGMTIPNFIRQERVSHAIRLLQSSKLSISAIAFECGFVDQSHLTRAFKKLMNTTPAKWRMQC